MSKGFFFIIFTFLAFTFDSNAFELKSNFNIIDSLIKNKTTAISKSDLQTDTIKIELLQHPADWLVQQNIYNSISSNGVVISDSKCKTILKLFIKNISVEYSKTKTEKLLKRVITIDFDGNLQNNVIKPLQLKPTIYIDTISYEDVPFVENTPYPFTKAHIPKENESFYAQYLEPIIYISSAVIVTILFFTLRSK